MKGIPLVKVAHFAPFHHFLSEGGCDVEQALCSMGIGLEALASGENLVPRSQACRFVEVVSRREGIDRIGLEVGCRTSIKDLGVFGARLNRSLTLHDLLRNLLTLMPLVDTGCRVWMESGESPDDVKLCYRTDDPISGPDASAFALLAFIDAVRMAAGPRWRPKKVWLEAAAGSNLNSYEPLSESALDRDVDYAAFEIPRECLPLAVARSARKAVGRDAFDEVLQATAPPEDFAGMIAHVIRASFGAASPTVRQVSEMANMSVRTLQRRLQIEDSSFGDLMDRIRFEEAVSLISQSSMPIADIARHLGYAETAPFSVAFRRWTGETPSHYRKAFEG